MSQFCLVQHVNLFPYSLARDSLGPQLMYIVYLDPFSIRKDVESSEKVELFRLDVNAIATFETARLKTHVG